MKLSYKQGMTIVIILAVCIIMLALVQELTSFKLDEATNKQINTVFFVAALFFFFTARKNFRKPDENESGNVTENSGPDDKNS